jgi:Mor family transcriptional regulator
MKLDENVINELYRAGAINGKTLRRLNILNAWQSGVPILVIAERYRVTRQRVYQIIAEYRTK